MKTRAGISDSWRDITPTPFTVFIEQLLCYYKGRKIHLVVDNAPWHKTKAIRRWLEEIKDLIEVHFLPKYCAETQRCGIHLEGNPEMGFSQPILRHLQGP